MGAGLAGKVPNSRRLGEYLTLFSDSALQRLQDCMRSVSERVVPLVAKACYREQGYVPVFIDGTGIEVQGKHFEKAAVGYNAGRQYSLRAVFVGRAWASARLHADGTDVKGGLCGATRRGREPVAAGRSAGVGAGGRGVLLQGVRRGVSGARLGLLGERDGPAQEGAAAAHLDKDEAGGVVVGVGAAGRARLRTW